MADQIAIRIAESVVSEGSAVSVYVNFRTRSTGTASTPSSIRYRVDCLTTKNAIVEWTSVSTASSVTITIPGTSNGIVNDDNNIERRQITVEIDTNLSTQAKAAQTWQVRNIRTYDGLFEWPPGLPNLEPYYPITSAEQSAGVTPTSYQYDPDPRIDLRRTGFSKSGTAAANTAGFLNAVDVAAVDGAQILLPAGSHAINAIEIDSDNIGLLGCGRGGTILYAGAGSQTLLRIAASYCSVEKIKIYGNSQSAVSGIVIADVDQTQTSTVTYHNYNTFRDIWVNGVTTGITLKPGPDVAGTDSQCFYNSFENIHVYQCTRGIWLREGTNAGSSGPNRNFFRGIRVGESGCNTGIHLESGDTNMFSQISFEGIATGTSPLATPTGLKILSADANGVSLLYNMFSQCFWEGCTRDLENANAYTEFFQCFPASAKTVLTAVPHYFIGGYLTTAGPMQSLHGFLMQHNGEVAGYANDRANLTAGANVPASLGYMLGAGGPTIYAGSGSPEGAVTAPVGSLYCRQDGGVNTSLYIKQSGSSSTGWAAVTP